MSYMWSAVSFCYYMIIFQLKYIPGNIYINSISSSLSEMVANILAGFLYKYLKGKLSFIICFSIALVGGSLILFLGVDDVKWVPVFITLAKGGIAANFTIVYIASAEVYPTLFTATALGINNFFARFLTILAPYVAELDPPIPMAVFCSLCIGGIVLALFIVEQKKID